MLRDRLARGWASALVADRVIEGSGARVELFGAPGRGSRRARHAGGGDRAPGCASSASDAMTGPAAGSGASRRSPVPAEGTRRERIEAVLGDHARWIERTVATAPEQWWTLLFPVWEDIR